METESRNPQRAHGLLGVIGGGVIIASYFLPSFISINPDAAPPYSNSDYVLVSGWDNIYQTLFGSYSYDQSSSSMVNFQGHVFSGLLSLVPIIMAVLILVLGIWAIFKQPGSLRSAITYAAVVIIAISLFGSINIGVNNYYGYNGNIITQNLPLLSLGSFVFFCGAFIAIVSAFLARPRN